MTGSSGRSASARSNTLTRPSGVQYPGRSAPKALRHAHPSSDHHSRRE
ncbi:MAG: hypothetical protein WKF31_03325 [Thermoleophilaceae bacterium]